jgi:hypothetical protein
MTEGTMRGHTSPRLLLVGGVLAAVVVTASSLAAQTATAPAGQSTAPSPLPAAADETAKGGGCSTGPKPTTAGGASVVQATGESLQHKKWQPQGGEIEFTVKSFTPIPADASVFVCFRWRVKSKQTVENTPEQAAAKAPKETVSNKAEFVESVPSRMDLSGDGKLLKVTTTVPRLASENWPWDKETAAWPLFLVPLADVRILAIDKKNETVADVWTSIGITYPLAGLAFALLTAFLAYVVLRRAATRRLPHGPRRPWGALPIISTPSGFASISQFQVLLWTFVVAVAAVYVMSLSGELIEITSGTLVLLGIAGAAGIGSKIHNESQAAAAETAVTKAAADKEAADVVAAEKKAAAAAPAPPDPAAAARIVVEHQQADTDAAAKGRIAAAAARRANRLKNVPADQNPSWYDLIVSVGVRDDGTTETREIDVARFQMLLFTVVTAVFVLVNVVSTYVIPEIPTGFLTLMGISNGVYLGSKIAQKS